MERGPYSFATEFAARRTSARFRMIGLDMAGGIVLHHFAVRSRAFRLRRLLRRGGPAPVFV